MAQLPIPVRQGLELYLAGNSAGAVDVWADSMIKFAKDLCRIFLNWPEQARSEVQGWDELRLKMKKFLKQYAQSGACKQCVFLQELIYPQNKFLRRFFLKLRHEQDSLFVEFITLQTPKGVYITHIHFYRNLREIIRDDKVVRHQSTTLDQGGGVATYQQAYLQTIKICDQLIPFRRWIINGLIKKRIKAFKTILEQEKVAVTVRYSRGLAANPACKQSERASW
jgi:hypothetical protein